MRLTLAPLGSYDIGAMLAAIAAFASYRLGALDASGAFVAFLIGTVTFGALQATGVTILLGFFVSSVALSRLGKKTKRERLTDIGKTGARDAAQVVANGGVATLCALAVALGWGLRYEVAFAGAFAAAIADTWGTEIGTLFGGAPRSILTFRPVGVGISGGVTLIGTLAELAGALFLAAIGYAFGVHAFLAILAGGISGALLDSILGASLQALRWCPQCARPCERNPHSCGATTTLLRGIGWLDNDGVNFAATLAGAAIAFALAR
jgi:uncharacterized protein (TIGR00297 family)